MSTTPAAIRGAQPNTQPISHLGNRMVMHRDVVRAAIEPRMALLAAGLTELAENLGSTRQSAKFAYDVQGVGRIETTALHDFHLRVDNPSAPREVHFSCARVGGVELKLLPQSPDEYFALRRRLIDAGLEIRSSIAATVGKIVVVPRIPVQCVFEADYARAHVRLRSRNLLALGRLEDHLAASIIDGRFVEEFGKFLLDEPNRWLGLAVRRVQLPRQ